MLRLVSSRESLHIFYPRRAHLTLALLLVAVDRVAANLPLHCIRECLHRARDPRAYASRHAQRARVTRHSPCNLAPALG